jgi:hypothetical protein
MIGTLSLLGYKDCEKERDAQNQAGYFSEMIWVTKVCKKELGYQACSANRVFMIVICQAMKARRTPSASRHRAGRVLAEDGPHRRPRVRRLAGEAAKQLIAAVTLAERIYFAAISFSDLRKAMAVQGAHADLRILLGRGSGAMK